MKKTFLVMTIAAATMLITSCSSKKELLACQEENKALQTNYTDTKEKLAASTARVASLEKQLAQAENTNAALQNALDKSLSNASQNNVSIEKLVPPLGRGEVEERLTQYGAHQQSDTFAFEGRTEGC